jgi:hypothetical protein
MQQSITLWRWVLCSIPNPCESENTKNRLMGVITTYHSNVPLFDIKIVEIFFVHFLEDTWVIAFCISIMTTEKCKTSECLPFDA